MELRHLRYFTAVAEARSFRRAAERLHVAQPPLSRQVRDLEEEIGAALLDRDRGGVRLTDAGRAFLPRAKRVLEEADRAVAAARAAAQPSEGELNVGSVGALAVTLMPDAIAAFHGRFPRVEVNLREMLRDRLVDALAAGELDVILTTGHAPLRRGMMRDVVLSSPVLVVMPSDHPLAAGSVTPARLDGAMLVGMGAATAQGYIEWVRSVCEQLGVSARFGRLADSQSGLLALVAAGAGLAIVPEVAARGLPRLDGIVSRPLLGRVPPFELIAVRAARGASQLAVHFTEALREAGVRQEKSAARDGKDARPAVDKPRRPAKLRAV